MTLSNLYNNNQLLIKRVVRTVFFITAAWGVIWSAQFFVSGNYYYRVNNQLEAWQSKPELVTQSKVSDAITKIDSAISMFPNNALYYQMRGQLYEWQAFVSQKAAQSTAQSAAESDKMNSLKLAFTNYQQSLSLRPLWPASWIGLASVKWKLNEVDDTFYQYMNKAAQTGPQDAVVHKFIVEYGLANFSARSPEYINVIQPLKHHMKLGLANPHSREAIVQSIVRYNAEEPACRWMRLASYPVRKRIPNCITYN
ncbi:VpsP family polysaccharide biosynthesis protein [Alteromonas sp. MMG017]|uniref:VpsP family polysaccharide biosynthesis protein n=1 Tax=Alteromonas sp. MMG017 TaxID=2822692 RepID=UPI001B3A324A|nr:VpsP family polysaccharide biosynthesis protein [Alteromonas sp. MMG017]